MTAHEALEAIARAAPGGALLWRSPRLDGRDIDVLVLAEAQPRVQEALRAAGLVPVPGDPGHIVWRALGPAAVEVDLLPAAAWPSAYPPLKEVVAGARTDEAPLPVAAAEHRLLVLAADAVAGRPLAGLLRKARAALAEPGACERLEARADAWAPLAALAADPDTLERRAANGRLPYPAALLVARSCRPARAALVRRVASRARAAVPVRRRGALVIALSGMDGAGKSTLAEALQAQLAAHGRSAHLSWHRLGTEKAMLDAVAGPVRRLLRREGTTADPVAAGGPTVTKVQATREVAGRRSPVTWTWVVFVAALSARSYRQSLAPLREGFDVICDRWRTDAVVDLRLRYGRHRVAEGLLRRAIPRADVAFLLELDAATAAARKPGDQAPHVLESARGLYAESARADGLAVLDATAPPEAVRASAAEVVEAALVIRR